MPLPKMLRFTEAQLLARVHAAVRGQAAAPVAAGAAPRVSGAAGGAAKAGGAAGGNEAAARNEVMRKTCTKCGESKPVTEFCKNVSRRDGLHYCCRTCNRIANAAWYSANTERHAANHAAWSASNPEKKKANNAKWRAANPEKERAYKSAWQASNQEKRRASEAKYRESNHEARRISHQNRRARKHANGGRLSKDLTERLFALQRGKCACGCKQPLGDAFHLDHRMPLALGGSNTDDNMQLLRARCNLQKKAKHPVEFMQSRGFLL